MSYREAMIDGSLPPDLPPTCQACGHDWFEHQHPDLHNLGLEGLCTVCYWERHGGPCYPWEFR